MEYTPTICECTICLRSREYKKYLNNITDQETKQWFERIQDTLCGLEESIACYKIYQENLKVLYPKIYKEVTTLRKLEKDEACFPEKQI